MIIELTVGIPMFRAKYIGWLPFEGLIRQEDITFDWELVVVEENSNSEVFGLERIKSYESRLKDVGCVKINYNSLEAWIPLARKHKILGLLADEKSRIYASNAADYYPAPKRLARHYEAFKEDIQCHLPTKGIFYSLIDKIAYLRDTAYSRRKDDVLGIARCMKGIKKLQSSDRVTAIDMWMWGEQERISKEKGREVVISYDDSDNWKYGLNVRGFNNLSDIDFSNVKFDKERVLYPIKEIERYVPSEIMQRLEESRVNLGKHKRSLN